MSEEPEPKSVQDRREVSFEKIERAIRRGGAFQRSRRLQEAQDAFEQVLRQAHDNFDARNMLGIK